jgi:ABC-type sugar transport system substrate-binding protein
MSNQTKEGEHVESPPQRVTRGRFLKRSALVAGGTVAASSIVAAVGGSGAGPAIAAGGTDEFPGGPAYDQAVRQAIGGRTVKIGFTPPIDSEFFDQMQHAAWAQLNQYTARFGVKFNWQMQAPSGNFNTEEQTFSIIQNWVTLGFDAVCVCTGADFGAMQKVYASALAKGISVYQFNMPVELWPLDEVKAIQSVGYNNVTGSGYIAGKYIADQLNGKASILQVWGPPGSTWSEARQKGLNMALSDYPGLKVVGKGNGGYVRDQGYTAAQNLLQAHPEATAIYGENEDMALGASQAVLAAGKKVWDGNDGILVIGADGLLSGTHAIQSGQLNASVYVGSTEQGIGLAQTILFNRLLGMAVYKVWDVPTVVVDKHNVDIYQRLIEWGNAAPSV